MIDTVSKLTSTITMHAKSMLACQLEPKAKIQQHPQMGSTGNKTREVKSIITLRASKIVVKHILNPHKIGKELISENKEEFHQPLTYEEITYSSLIPSFLQILIQPKKSNYSPVIYAVFKQVKVNIPLLNIIKQVPSY